MMSENFSAAGPRLSFKVGVSSPPERTHETKQPAVQLIIHQREPENEK